MADESNINRRDMLASTFRVLAAGSVAGVFFPALVSAGTPGTLITVYKDASCQCCAKWVLHLSQNGFAPKVIERTDMNAIKDSMGVPVALRSCHTAVIAKYIVEGHVPAADVRRLLASTPQGVAGLAAPGMPSGSPGMEMPGRLDKYDVIAFTTKGTTSVFARHG
ncbi:MAG: DUF411 domain-containing protein [bacterium]